MPSCALLTAVNNYNKSLEKLQDFLVVICYGLTAGSGSCTFFTLGFDKTWVLVWFFLAGFGLFPIVAAADIKNAAGCLPVMYRGGGYCLECRLQQLIAVRHCCSDNLDL